MAEPSFTLAELSVWVATFSTAVGVVIASWKSIKEWIQAKWSKRHESDSLDVERSKVRVTEKEAETHEVQVLFAAYDQLLTAANSARVAAEKGVQEAHDNIAAIQRINDERMTAMEMRVGRVENINAEMKNHILVLEAMVPNPPGPPARPDWHLR